MECIRVAGDEMVPMFCEGKKIPIPKEAQINKSIANHSSGLRKKRKAKALAAAVAV
ncbi:hypothetical protein RvY_16328 [Ramazzottius varieornatus]|uniref:Uncharacterized protein n=1 Tax=Ramazzottius varieornatus TaxID=947166 RepID=A0A1D1W4I5_RAMVA|nr:hypothetical protein RvY_16328 [Ramazzottius varieornatus]